MKRYAAIDIGSNTILMTVAELSDSGTISVLADKHEIARLGEKVDSTGLIREEALERARIILSGYKTICDQFAVSSVRAAATSAMRDAKNSAAVAEVLSQAIGADIEIITGKKEAALSFLGSINYDRLNFLDLKYANDSRTLVIDIGGGSTELITGSGMDFESSTSINIGSVRITEKFFSSHPPNEAELLKAKAFIKEAYRKSGFNPGKIDSTVAVAGTATTIAAIGQKILEYDFNKINGYLLTREKLDEILAILLSVPVSVIISGYGVHPKRADVITAGALILRTLMDEATLDFSLVSVQGLRFGLLFDLIMNDIK